jgi:UDP-GlcNAc3NAcA epimerase
MKILTVVGARPQFIKAAPISRALRGAHSEVLVHTGQHYDDAMSALFFRDLEIPAPDVNLQVGSGRHGAQTAEMIHRLEPVIEEHQPDGILVYGDTNSTLAAAVVACKTAYADGRRPWLAHVEAGLRSFNPAMPEERNRIVADHLADLLLAPTPAAMQNLEGEGLAERAELVGDVMVDAFAWAIPRAFDRLPTTAREHPGYVLVTMHRAENVDHPSRLVRWIEALDLDLPVIFPLHPRTRVRLERAGSRLPSNVFTMDPVGYLEMVALEHDALAIATDSGGVQKEAYLASVPCITLRTETEWVETVESGWNRVVGDDPSGVRAALDDRAFMSRTRPHPDLFGDGRAAKRSVEAMARHNDRTAASSTRPAKAFEAPQAAAK